MAGIYWKGYFTGIAIPKDGVKPERDETYTDYFDRPHRSEAEILERIKQFFIDIERPEYLDMVMDTGE